MKHGTKETALFDRKTGLPRWKYTFDDIVYITDHTSRVEITSYPLPLDIAKVRLTEEELQRHTKALASIKASPQSIKSHTVLVVDQSGSMKESDVPDFRSRSDAVYGALALDFVEAQLEGKAAGPPSLDIVSLIEMRSDANVIFEAQPLDWILFNALLDRRKTAKPKSHGNYAPSLLKAKELLQKFSHGSCALVLFFLSDGKPSDGVSAGPGSVAEKHVTMMKGLVSKMAEQHGRRLTVGTVGFAKNEDFSVLEVAGEWERAGSRGVG